MGLFSRKPTHDQSLEALLKLTLMVFRFSSIGDQDGTVRFLRPDSRFRLLFFSLCTAHVAGAATMRNPDAVLNDAMAKLVQLTFMPEAMPGETMPCSELFAGPKQPQAAGNLAAQCVGDFLHRYSAWVDIRSSANPSSSTDLIAAMLRDVEATSPLTDGDDVTRLTSIAYGIESMIPEARALFK